MKILNLTQHPATPEQRAQGVIDLNSAELVTLKQLLNFSEIPSQKEVKERAHDIALLASFNQLSKTDDEDIFFTKVMIGGAPFLMVALEKELKAIFKEPLYAFSKRESIESMDKDGGVIKQSVFKHIGFVEASS